jgi:hypothetical protein
MIKPLLAAGVLAAALAAAASAQQTQPPASPPPAPQAEQDVTLVGLPVFSSDGQKLGKVTEVGTVPGGQQAIRAEMGEFLGIGETSVVIGSEVFQKKTDRVELSMTEAEVKDSISKQRNRRKN